MLAILHKNLHSKIGGTLKRLSTFIFLLFCLGVVSAKWSDVFPLGTYSYLLNEPQAASQLSDRMWELGYNTNIFRVHHLSTDLSTLFSTLDADSIDVILQDCAVDNTSNIFRLPKLGTGSYYLFEAEYKDESTINDNEDLKSVYWYGSRSEGTMARKGESLEYPSEFASNNNVWRCRPDSEPIESTEGWAYTDLRWRWADVTYHYLRRIGSEFTLTDYHYI